MLTTTNRMNSFIANQMKAEAIERLIALNGDKKFERNIFKYISAEDVNTRMKLVEDARVVYSKALEEAGCKTFCEEDEETNVKSYGLIYEGRKYFYSATDLEVYNKAKYLVSTLVDEVFKDNEKIQALKNNYLQSFWVGARKFKKIIKMGMPVPVIKGLSYDESIEIARFFMTVKQFSKTFSNYVDDAKILGSYLKQHDYHDLQLLGLVKEVEDYSRSEDEEKKIEYFDTLTDDEMVVWFLSRTCKKFVERVFGDMGELEYNETYDLDYIFESVISLKGVEIPTKYTEDSEGNRVPQRIGTYSIWNAFISYYENGYVDKAFIATLGGSTEYAFDQYLLKRAAWKEANK